MKLYQTSSISVVKPDTLHSRDFLDFGKWFYLTSIHEQALRYADRFIRRQRDAWINVYEFIFEPTEWKVRTFDSYDKEWLSFVGACRAGKDDTEFDLVIGGIANDKVIQTLDRYFEGELTEELALGLLKFEKPNIQYCVRSQRMLDACLKHIKSKQLWRRKAGWRFRLSEMPILSKACENYSVCHWKRLPIYITCPWLRRWLRRAFQIFTVVVRSILPRLYGKNTRELNRK